MHKVVMSLTRLERHEADSILGLPPPPQKQRRTTKLFEVTPAKAAEYKYPQFFHGRESCSHRNRVSFAGPGLKVACHPFAAVPDPHGPHCGHYGVP